MILFFVKFKKIDSVPQISIILEELDLYFVSILKIFYFNIMNDYIIIILILIDNDIIFWKNWQEKFIIPKVFIVLDNLNLIIIPIIYMIYEE